MNIKAEELKKELKEMIKEDSTFTPCINHIIKKIDEIWSDYNDKHCASCLYFSFLPGEMPGHYAIDESTLYGDCTKRKQTAVCSNSRACERWVDIRRTK